MTSESVKTDDREAQESAAEAAALLNMPNAARQLDASGEKSLRKAFEPKGTIEEHLNNFGKLDCIKVEGRLKVPTIMKVVIKGRMLSHGLDAAYQHIMKLDKDYPTNNEGEHIVPDLKKVIAPSDDIILFEVVEPLIEQNTFTILADLEDADYEKSGVGILRLVMTLARIFTFMEKMEAVMKMFGKNVAYENMPPNQISRRLTWTSQWFAEDEDYGLELKNKGLFALIYACVQMPENYRFTNLYQDFQRKIEQTGSLDMEDAMTKLTKCYLDHVLWKKQKKLEAAGQSTDKKTIATLKKQLKEAQIRRTDGDTQKKGAFQGRNTKCPACGQSGTGHNHPINKDCPKRDSEVGQKLIAEFLNKRKKGKEKADGNGSGGSEQDMQIE